MSNLPKCLHVQHSAISSTHGKRCVQHCRRETGERGHLQVATENSDEHAAVKTTSNTSEHMFCIISYHLETFNPAQCLRIQEVQLAFRKQIQSCKFSMEMCRRALSRTSFRNRKCHPQIQGLGFHLEIQHTIMLE